MPAPGGEGRILLRLQADEDLLDGLERQEERAGIFALLDAVDGIEKGEYTRSFLLPFEPIEEILIRLQAQEYAAFSAGRWHLTPKGFMLSNSILVELLEAQQKSRPLTQKK